MADVFILLIQVADSCGIDIAQASQMKLMENDMRSPITLMNSGIPDPYSVSKEVYEQMGGKDLFYQIYLMLLAED
jgi:hypothetical protein